MRFARRSVYTCILTFGLVFINVSCSSRQFSKQLLRQATTGVLTDSKLKLALTTSHARKPIFYSHRQPATDANAASQTIRMMLAKFRDVATMPEKQMNCKSQVRRHVYAFIQILI